MNKLIYISIFALTPQIERYLLIRDVIASGIKVEYWDLKRIYSKDFDSKNFTSREYIRELSSLDELKSRLKKEDLAETVFVLQVDLEWKVLSLFYIFKHFGCRSVYFPWVPYVRTPSLIRAVTKIRSVFFFGSLLNLIARLIDKAGLIKRFDLVFTAGQITSDALRRRTRVKNINYQDYDNYMSARNNKDRLVTGNYCVFLDEGCTNYPYAKILKIKDIDPVMFYAAFNRLFDEVERKFNLRVVIAAHPDIKYDRPVFGDRNIYEGKTCELVRDCQFVIAQSSTSVSFAVFYKKPIIFVYTDEFRAKWKLGFRVMEFHAKELGLTLYNIDLNNDLPAIDVPSVNFGLYDKLKYRCFTSKESENEFSKDIVIRTLKSLQ